jgi:hypothetical protein
MNKNDFRDDHVVIIWRELDHDYIYRLVTIEKVLAILTI